MKRFFSILILSVLFLFSNGCGGYRARNYEGPKLDVSEISIITTDDQFVTIGGIDGKKSIDKSDTVNVLIWGRYPREISVLPGKHSILPCYQNPYENACAENWITIETEPGQTYIVKHERLDENKKKIKFWIDKLE
ncbi:MAG: hypothetical protein KJ826_17090 [Proteobacteria bacterium]|nr:hypothetical protein [Pseudomonadota bacterium]